MSNFKLINKTDGLEDFSITKTVKSFDAEYLPDVLFHITDFLKGVGYVFDGTIGIIEDESLIELNQSICDDIQMELDFDENK